MDLCHLKNSELEPQYQKYKGRDVLRGDIGKDDSGSYAVFTEHGSLASQMTAAKVMDRNRIDGMPTEFEWNIFPGITTLGLLEKIQSVMRDLQCEPEHFKDLIIFMSVYNDIVW